jgi:LPS-assembly protein
VKFYFTLLYFLFASQSFAKPIVPNQAVYVDADKYLSYPDQTADLEGHVILIRGTEQITCDKAHVNLKTNDVTAVGNVTVLTPKDFIKAERADYGFDTQKGVIYNGFIQTGQETIEGRIIFKTGASNYSAIDGTYTSCVNCSPSWKLSGSKIDATVGDYAYITNPIVRIKNFPVLWLPYMIIPIKSERQSGLLAPGFGFSDTDGFTLSESYFWAIDKSHDLTDTVTSYKKRGYKNGVEYRYFSDKFSKGTLNGFFLNDRVLGSDSKYINPDPRYVDTQGTGTKPSYATIPRYAVHYDHHFVLPEDYVQNMNINFVSDSFYIYDFPHDISGQGEDELENRVSLAKNTEDSHWDIDVDVYQNLLKADPLGDDNLTVHRVPEFDYSLMPQRIYSTGFQAGLNASYLNLSRAARGFDAPPNQGAFIIGTPGNLYRTGQRLLINPSLTYPFTLGKVFDIDPEVEYEEADYSFGYSNKPTTSRRFFRTSVAAKTRLSSVFGEDDPQGVKHKYKHEFEPEVKYTIVPYLSQEEHQFFGSSEFPFVPHYAAAQPITEYDDFQFDYRDRLVDRNLVTVSVTNKWIKKTISEYEGNNPENKPLEVDRAGNPVPSPTPNPDIIKDSNSSLTPTYAQIIRHTLSESYDLDNASEPDFQRIKNFQTGTFAIDPLTQAPYLVPNPKQPWSEVRSLLELNLFHFAFTSDVSYYPYQKATTDSNTATVRDKWGDAISLRYSQSFAIQSPTTAAAEINGVGPQTNLLSSRSDAAALTGYITTRYIDASVIFNYDILGQTLTSEALNALLKPAGKCWGLNFYIEQNVGQSHPSYMVTLPIYFGQGKSLTVGRPPGI